MHWLLWVAAALCLLFALRVEAGTGFVLLLLAMALLLALLGSARLLRQRPGRSQRSAEQLLDAALLNRLREQAEARRQGVAPPEG